MQMQDIIDIPNSVINYNLNPRKSCVRKRKCLAGAFKSFVQLNLKCTQCLIVGARTIACILWKRETSIKTATVGLLRNHCDGQFHLKRKF